MATLADVGIKTIRRAKRVHRSGLDEQVLSGALTFSRAYDQCREQTDAKIRSQEPAISSVPIHSSLSGAERTLSVDLQHRVDQLERDLRLANAEITVAAHRVERAREDATQAEHARFEEERRADRAEARVIYLERKLREAKVSFDDPGPRQPRLVG